MRQGICLGSGSWAGLWVLIAAGLVQAQARKIEVDTRVKPARSAAGGVRVSNVIGAKVSIHDNIAIGKIDDLVLTEDGSVDYLVVLNEDKYVLVPWEAAKIDFGRRAVTIEIRKDKFQEIPTFTREAWPNLSDAKYTERIYKSYGVKRPLRERRLERRDDRKDRRR